MLQMSICVGVSVCEYVCEWLWVFVSVCASVPSLCLAFGKPNTGDRMGNPNQTSLRDIRIIDFIPY